MTWPSRQREVVEARGKWYGVRGLPRMTLRESGGAGGCPGWLCGRAEVHSLTSRLPLHSVAFSSGGPHHLSSELFHVTVQRREMVVTQNLPSLLCVIGKHQLCKDFLYKFTLIDPKQLNPRDLRACCLENCEEEMHVLSPTYGRPPILMNWRTGRWLNTSRQWIFMNFTLGNRILELPVMGSSGMSSFSKSGQCLSWPQSPRFTTFRHDILSEKESGQAPDPSPSLVRVFWQPEQNAANLSSQDNLPESSLTSGSRGNKATAVIFLQFIVTFVLESIQICFRISWKFQKIWDDRRCLF